MKAREENGIITIFSKLPTKIPSRPNVNLYQLQDDSMHVEDGYWDVEDKLALGINQKYGNIEQKGSEKKYHFPILNKTTEEIESELKKIKDAYKLRINSYYSLMSVRALSSSMNKSTLDSDFLLALRGEYEDKYNVSKGLLTSGSEYDVIQDTILGEMEDEFSEIYLNEILPLYGLQVKGTHLEKMYSIIIFKFEYGLKAFNTFNKFIRRFRTKCNKWVDSSDFNKLYSAFLMLDNLPDSLTTEDGNTMYINFNNI